MANGWTEERRQALALRNHQRVWTEASRQKVRLLHQGLKHSAEAKRKIGVGSVGRKKTPGELEKISIGLRKYNQEARLRGVVREYSPEMREKMRALGKMLVGPKAGRWKGGRRKNRGYVYVWAPEHPYARHNYVFEHRLVMEKHLGRVLLPTEVVHHINSNCSDNRIENLMLFSSSGEHKAHHNRTGVR